MIYQVEQLCICREAGGQSWNLGQDEREDIVRTQKLIIPLDCLHLSQRDRTSAERAEMLYCSRSGIHICCETSSIICSNLGFIKMEPNFIWINHVQLEIWGAGGGGGIVLNLKKKKKWTRKPTWEQLLERWHLEGMNGHVVKLCI